MWNLSTDFRPQKLSKLTISKFHIQNWRFGTYSSHGMKFAKCEICGSTKPCVIEQRKVTWFYMLHVRTHYIIFDTDEKHI